jgi:glycosyltransferase involved in cell wall biosynthesis
MKVLFLYTELAGYLIACLENLVKKDVEVHLVHWPVNKEAPFVFDTSPAIFYYERHKYDKRQILELADQILPDVIFCSGWTDAGYRSVCKQFKNTKPVIAGFDNKWKGSLKQRAAVLLAPIFIHNTFTHCWIPGEPQLPFAHRLRFADNKILQGFYSCDYNYFHQLALQAKDSKKNKFPHRFVFIGRYYEFKGIIDLWKAFVELQTEKPNDWELWCLGTGSVPPIIHSKIKHFGFVQPKDIRQYILETGVFVLPSLFEPWGVAVHEYASAGFPLICSDKVGASAMFLRENLNGFIFQSGNVKDLKSVLHKIISLSDDALFNMGEKSAELAKQNTPDKWSEALMSVVR